MENILFLPIRKIDEEQRLVYLRAAQEIPDRTRPIPEVMDYITSRPHFEKWSQDQYEASLGKSYGNVRAMHAHIAAGIVAQPLTFDDDDKAIDAVLKISDDQEWAKCLDGTYTGGSIGGSYLEGSKKYQQYRDQQVMRYTAVPNELSLVDRPMIATATFQLVKGDGTTEEHLFKSVDRSTANVDDVEKGDYVGHAFHGNQHVGAEGAGKEHEASRAAHQATKNANDKAGHAKAAKAHDKAATLHEKAGNANAAGYHQAMSDYHSSQASGRGSKKIDFADDNFQKVAAREGVNPEEGEKQYGDVTFADAKNKKYPVDTEAHIRAAWSYANMPKNAAKYSAADLKTIKAKIISAWKAKIDKDGPPSVKEGKVKKNEAVNALQKWAGEEVSDVSSAVYALQQIIYLYGKETDEDGPEAQAQMTSLGEAIKALKDFIVSEIQEADEDDVIKLAERIGDLSKLATGELQKVGAAHSKETMGKIQAIHDHTIAMGATCKCDKCDTAFKCAKCEADGAAKVDHAGDLQKVQGDLAKISGERDDALQKIDALTAEKSRYADVLAKVYAPTKGLTIDQIEKLPAPAKAALKDTSFAITKVQDGGGNADDAVERVVVKAEGLVKSGNPEAAAMEFIKFVHKAGQRPPTAPGR